MHLSEIAEFAGITVQLDGDFQTLGFISDPHQDMLVFLENSQFLGGLRRNQSIRAVLTTAELASFVPPGLALAICPEPRIAFANLHNELAFRGFYWEDFPTVIDPAAKVHPAAWIAERNVRIGAATVIEPNATVLERCVVGKGVVVGSGAVLGGVGFQTVRTTQPMIEMNHAGGLFVQDRVRILPGAVVATGLFRHGTTISADSRIGSNAFVSHGVDLGTRVFIGHGAVINGNVAIAADSWIGPGAIVTQNLQIGEKAFLSPGAVVISNVPPGAHVSSNFAMSHRRLLRMLAAAGPGSRASAPPLVASAASPSRDVPPLSLMALPLPNQELPAPAISNLGLRADRMISEHGFLGVPLETFSQAGREQLIAFLREGLRPESKLLEFGCGCLRIAYWLVRFLDADRYYGIEPAYQRVDYGLRYLFTREEIQFKRPRFDFNPTFNSSVFGTKFDFFLARSIWTHASKSQIEATLNSFLGDAAPAATFLASYLPAHAPEDDYQGSNWVGTSHESDTPGVICHALSWILDQCRIRGLSCEEIPGVDCDSQLWLRIRRQA